jgi:teichuronic acid biosynthesis glycosyltransferase TuaH
MLRSDVVFTFSGDMLDDAVQREFCRPSDQTLLALAADDRVGRLLVADSLRSLPVSLARRRPVQLREQITIAGRAATRLRPQRLRRTESTSLSSIKRAYRRYGRLLGQALAREQSNGGRLPDSTTLVTYDPFVAAFADAPWIRKVIFVAQDDWATGEGVRPWWPAYREAYRRIDERRADIFAVSEELASRISPRVTVVPNGVSPAIWRQRYPAPARIAALPRPRMIYTGTVDDRLERRLIEQTVEAAGTLIMIGHVGHQPTVDWLRSLDGVHVFDTVGQSELAATVQACDVGLIPHRQQAGIRAMSPLKLYEYLAAGLPVVSVDLPPIHGVDDDRVLIVRPEDWQSALARAITFGHAAEDHRLRFLASASWERRMRPIVDAAVGH